MEHAVTQECISCCMAWCMFSILHDYYEDDSDLSGEKAMYLTCPVYVAIQEKRVNQSGFMGRRIDP